MITEFLITIFVVGFVTAGVNIRFDRFFTILMMMFVFKMDIHSSIDAFLWVLNLGALTILLQNKEKIFKLPSAMKLKMFVVIPLFTVVASYLGTLVFGVVSNNVLIITLGVLAILYGLRLIFIHFKAGELDLQNGSPVAEKLCGLLGPIISGFSIGMIGTSLKPLKIPLGIKLGGMNGRKVYLGNTMTAFFASAFTMMWHQILNPLAETKAFYDQAIFAIALWAGIHFTFEITNLFFRDSWRKFFQILIGIALLIASVKIFGLVG